MPEEQLPELEQAKKERDEYLNGWKRAKADLINYQKEEAQRLEDTLKFANSGLVRELIPVLDSFALEEKHGAKNPVRGQLETILKKIGLERMSMELGKPFDPNFQEAVAEAESDQPVGTIIEEVEAGYLLNGRVIRPTKVKLSKGKQPLATSD